MREKQTKRALAGLLILSLVSTTSCIDNDYDLNKDIDLTITIGGDHLGFPTSNTEEITLKKIFDLDDDSDIKADAVTGDYSLKKEGDGEETNVTVDEVVISGSEIDIKETSTEITFSKPTIEGYVGTVSESVNDKSSLDIDKNDVTEDVVSISNAKTNSNLTINLNFTQNTTVTMLYIENGFTITLPKYLNVEFKDGSLDGYELTDNHILKFKGTKTITHALPLSIPLIITNIDFNELQANNENLSLDEKQGLYEIGKLRINDEILISGKASIDEKDFGDNPQVTLDLITKVDMPDMQITEITGIVDPKIDDITIDNVTIDNLPDFLQDDAVKMDIDNPRILLTVTNTSPIDVTISGELQPLKKDKTLAPVTFGKDNGKAEVIVPGNATNYVIRLARKEVIGSDIPEEVPSAVDKTVILPDLNNLIETIPDEIAFNNITAKAIQKEKDITLGETYNVTTKYVFDAPLAFGENLNIIYKDTLDEWNEDIQDFEIKKAIVKIDAKNGIPLAMHLKATAIDVNQDPINEITALVTDDKEITASNGTNVVETKDLEIVLTTTVDGAMKRLDGLILEVTATTGGVTGVNLNEKTQTLKLDNIRIKVPGGVKLDLN